MKSALALALVCFGTFMANAAITSERVEYSHDGTTLEGYYVYDDARQEPRPAVLVVHQWMGLTAYEKRRATMLAELGYVVFAVDIYGKGIRPETTQEAGKLAGQYKGDRALLRGRVNAGLAKLKSYSRVDSSKVAAIGYCFGGTTVLELARSGADVRGVVSFHGGLGSPKPEDARSIRCKVLALHGADDPFVPNDEVLGFQKELRDAKVDYQFVAYGGAVHSFTHKEAGSDNSKGAAYNETADRRSWEAMRTFFAELFR